MKRGDIFLSVAESAKFNVISRVVDGLLTIKAAANMLSLSKRQIMLLKKDVHTALSSCKQQNYCASFT